MTQTLAAIASLRDTAKVRLGGMSPALTATTDTAKVRLGGMRSSF